MTTTKIRLLGYYSYFYFLISIGLDYRQTRWGRDNTVEFAPQTFFEDGPNVGSDIQPIMHHSFILSHPGPSNVWRWQKKIQTNTEAYFTMQENFFTSLQLAWGILQDRRHGNSNQTNCKKRNQTAGSWAWSFQSTYGHSFPHIHISCSFLFRHFCNLSLLQISTKNIMRPVGDTLQVSNLVIMWHTTGVWPNVWHIWCLPSF